jgi:hypothetical protein
MIVCVFCHATLEHARLYVVSQSLLTDQRTKLWARLGAQAPGGPSQSLQTAISQAASAAQALAQLGPISQAVSTNTVQLVRFSAI